MTTTPPLPRASDQAAERTLEQRLESIREFGDSQLFNDVRTGQIPIHTALERIESERAAIAHSAAQAPEGAPTCKPANERARFEEHFKSEGWGDSHFERYNIYDPYDTRSYKSRHVSDIWEGWQARAAQGAGTAPVGAERIACPECKGTGGVRATGDCSDCNGKGYDWESTDAPVSTAAAPTCKPAQAAPEALEDAPVGMVLVPVEMTDAMWRAWNGISNELSTEDMEEIYRAMLRAAPEVPATEQQVATTASASIEETNEIAYAQSAYRHFMDFPTFKAFRADCARRAADGQQGANRITERKVKEIGEREGMALVGYVLQSDDGRACIVHQGAVRWLSNEELWSIVHPADGQQGASRAVLTPEQIFDIAAPHSAWNADSWHKATQGVIGMPALLNYTRAVTDAAIARAPLPAQGAAQVEVEAARDADKLEVFIDWYLRGGEYAGINPNGHMVRTTRADILAWLDRSLAAKRGGASHD